MSMFMKCKRRKTDEDEEGNLFDNKTSKSMYGDASKMKSELSCLSLRQINKFYMNSTSQQIGKYSIIGHKNRLFLGHETLTILNSWTYDYGIHQKEVEVLLGRHRQHFAFCCPFKSPDFIQFLSHQLTDIKSVSSQSVRSNVLLSALNDYINFFDALKMGVKSTIEAIQFQFFVPQMKRFVCLSIDNSNSFNQITKLYAGRIEEIERLLSTFTHVYLNVHITYACDEEEAKDEDGDTKEEIIGTSDKTILYKKNVKNRKAPFNRSVTKKRKRSVSEPTGYPLEGCPSDCTDSLPSVSVSTTSSLSNANQHRRNEKLNTTGTAFAVNGNPCVCVLHLQELKSWYVLTKLDGDGYRMIRSYAVSSGGYAVTRCHALRFAAKLFEVLKSGWRGGDGDAQRFSRYVSQLLPSKRRDSRLSSIIKQEIGLKDIHSLRDDVVKPMRRLHQRRRVFISTIRTYVSTQPLFTTAFTNMAIDRHISKDKYNRGCAKELQIIIRERKQYLKKVADEIRVKTDQIIAAKKRREETFFEWRRKQPIDKYDPSLIADKTLSEEGVLLRQVKDLNYYQRQVMYSRCIECGFQAPIKVGWNECKEKGRSVYAAYRIEQGEFVLEYKGDLIDKNEHLYRETASSSTTWNASMSFVFSFKMNGKRWYIDATSEQKYWGAGRLVNHSHLHPNLGVNAAFVEGKPRLFFYALREIKTDEELLVNYGEQDGSIINSPQFSWLTKS